MTGYKIFFKKEKNNITAECKKLKESGEFLSLWQSHHLYGKRKLKKFRILLRYGH